MGDKKGSARGRMGELSGGEVRLQSSNEGDSILQTGPVVKGEDAVGHRRSARKVKMFNDIGDLKNGERRVRANFRC